MNNPFEEILTELSEIKQMLSIAKTTTGQPVEIIDRHELLKRLGISEPTAILWAKKGILPEIRIGNSVRYNWPAVVEKLEKGE